MDAKTILTSHNFLVKVVSRCHTLENSQKANFLRQIRSCVIIERRRPHTPYQSPCGGTPLSRCTHGSKQYPPHDHLHIRVLSNDDSIVPAELKDVLAEPLLNLNSDLLTNLKSCHMTTIHRNHVHFSDTIVMHTCNN